MDCFLEGCVRSNIVYLEGCWLNIVNKVFIFRIQSNLLMRYFTYGNKDSPLFCFVRRTFSVSPMNRLVFKEKIFVRDITSEPGIC